MTNWLVFYDNCINYISQVEWHVDLLNYMGVILMSIQIITESIVVRATQHNPSILSPLFLKVEKIVPDEWTPVNGYFSTPPLSVVKYSNGVEFLVDNQVLQISRNVGVNDSPECDISNFALHYIRVLPHTPYSAVGINFEGLVRCNTPEQFLLKTFLKQGKWNKGDNVVGSLKLILTYQKQEWTLSISIEPNRGLLERNSDSFLLISANFHLNISNNEKMEQVENALKNFESHRKYFNKLINDIIPIKEQ